MTSPLMTFPFSWRIFILSILSFQEIYLIVMELIYANRIITLIRLSSALTVLKLVVSITHVKIFALYIHSSGFL